MSKNGYHGDFNSFAEEQDAYKKHQEGQEPNAVQCYGCGDPMYEEHTDPKRNYCRECKSQEKHHKPNNKKRHNR